MTTWKSATNSAGVTRSAMLTLVVLATAHAAEAQPARPSGESPRSDPSRSVTLSLTEYNRLTDLASRSPQPPAGAPVASLLASAELRVRIDRDTAHGVFTLAGEVLRPGYNRVNLMTGATLLDASTDGRPLALAAENNVHSALLPGPAPFTVTLDWGTALTFAPGRASFVLPVPPSGTARATIDVPGEQADIHVSAGIVTRRVVSGGRTQIEAALRPGTPAEVWWSMRDAAPVAAAREVRMLADVLTLLTIGDSDVRMAALVDVSVVKGEPRTIELRLPAGYELSAISGPAIESSELRDGGVVLTVANPSARRIQFLASLERAHPGGSFTTESDFVALPGVQRERGEIAIEGVGTLDLSAAEKTGLHRIDVRELNGALQSLARLPILSAFRYQRGTNTQVALAMQVQRFPDAGVLAAVADRAVATTLVTAEGRALTEVVLHVRNRAQPFLKVTLPAGATIVSVEVAGEGAKPVVGADGTRVPLLRSGFRPTKVYQVSYVYVHAGTPFARKGELLMALPRMDIPVGIVEWEVFVPDAYNVRATDGNVIERAVLKPLSAPGVPAGVAGGSAGGTGAGASGGRFGVGSGPGSGRFAAGAAYDKDLKLDSGALPGQIRGTARDPSGAPLPGVTILVRAGSTQRAVVTAGDGSFLISGLPSGTVDATAQLTGFAPQRHTFAFDQQPRGLEFVLAPAAAQEALSTRAARPMPPPPPPPPAEPAPQAQKTEPSQNVLNLQRRAAGVLPIRVDVPRAGTSHQFVKPLVVDQEATVSLRYKRR